MSTKSIQSNTRKVPELRFPGFEGEWKEKRLGEVATFLKGKGISKDEIGENYRNKCIHYGELYTRYGEVIENVISRTNFPKEKSVLSKENDTLMPTSDVTPKGLATASSLKEPGVILGGDILVIRSDHILNSFLSYYIEAHKKDVMRLVSGVTVYHIYGSDLKTLKIFIPPLSEQQKIASLLINVDKYILNLRLKKESLETYKKGMMQKIFSQEIRFKDNNGAEFPKWEEKKLEEVAEINPLSNDLPEKFIYIDLESVEKGTLKHENMILRNDAPSRAQRVLNKQDIIFQTVRPYQQNNLYFNLDGSYVASTGYVQIRTVQCSMFIYQYLHTQDFLSKVIVRCTGSSYPAINSNDFKKIKIILPFLSEQQEISNFLTSLDKVIDSKEKQIIQVEQWKKGLIQRLFV